MKMLFASDFAIAHALKVGSLKVTTQNGRFGEYAAISDAAGLIEVHNSMAEAEKRIAEIQRKIQ